MKDKNIKEPELKGYLVYLEGNRIGSVWSLTDPSLPNLNTLKMRLRLNERAKAFCFKDEKIYEMLQEVIKNADYSTPEATEQTEDKHREIIKLLIKKCIEL